MNVLIIEDEPRAANQLQQMLKACAFSYQLLGILDTVEEAVVWFEQHPVPDLVFMDVQLADGLSFEIFGKVWVEAPIIFTTAFDQYAIQAFKVNSVDYLLKPIQQSDLQAALDKFTKTTHKQTLAPEILQQLLASVQKPAQRSGMLVREGSGFVQLSLAQVLYFYSEESTTFGVTSAKRYLVDETLDRVYRSLDPSLFFRINRAQIVAKTAIQKIHPYFNHRVKLTVLNSRDQEFVVSRPKTGDFKRWLNQ